MNVVTCIDAGYALLHSLRGHASSAQMRVYVVGHDLDEALVDRIERAGSEHLRSIRCIPADGSRVRHLPVQRWISPAAYLKLLAPGLLPPDAERAIMLDADLIVRSDPGPLWSSEMADRLLLAVQDYGCPYVSDSFGIRRYRELGLAADTPYFNSGVMLLDLARWRDEEIERRSLQYLEAYADELRCHDQEALNVVAAGRWGALDPRWNQMPHIHSAERLPPSPHRERLLAQRAAIVRDPHIIHYAARQKPWLPGCSHPARAEFLRHLRSSGYLPPAGYLRWRWRLERDSWQVRTSLMPVPEHAASLASVDHPTQAAESLATPPAPRYRALGTTGLAAGRQQVWLHSARSGVSRIVPSGVAGLLFGCERFQTLDEHAERTARAEARRTLLAASGARGFLARFLARQMEATGAPAPVRHEAVLAVRRQLEGFVRDGFLVAEPELFVRVVNPVRSIAVTELEPAQVSILGIPTRDRPALLARALESYAANLQVHGRTVRIIVADDSRHSASIESNRAAAMRVQREFEIGVTVVDREWRERYADRIAAESGVPLDVVRFALLGDARCGLSYGAARNTLQLLSAGRVAVHVDDDTLCRQWRAVERPGEVRSGVDDGGMQYWYLPDGSESCDAVEEVHTDFVGTHETLLGAPASGLPGRIAARTLAVEITDPSGGWIAGDHGCAGIGVTLGGGVGDSGLRNAWPRLFFDGPSFDRLVEDESGYHDRLVTRRVVRVAPRSTVTDSQVCIGMNLGLDHRQLLPPFMPVQRMEDGIFMTVLRRCMPWLGAGHLSYAVEHRPEGRAASETLSFRQVGREFHVNDCLQWLILLGGSGRWSDDPDANLRFLGRYLEEMASLQSWEFEAQLRLAGARVFGQQIAALERRLEDPGGQPAGWARDVRRYIQALQFALTLPDPWVPADLTGSPEERVHVLRSLVGRYGALLRHWVAMREKAKRMSDAVLVPADRSPMLTPPS